MIEKGNFNDFNSANYRSLSNINYIGPTQKVLKRLQKSSSEYPKINRLLTATTYFYEENFNALQSHIVREKRKLEFETPNRVFVSYEYTLNDSSDINQGTYYLFNTASRLSWLKIYLSGNQISIISKDEICKLLNNILKDEVANLSKEQNIPEDVILSSLYDISDGKPCFISVNTQISNNFLKIEYFDSFEKRDKLKGCELFSPIIKKEISYKFRPVNNGSSCWLYVKAPNDFHVTVNTINEVESPKTQDEEILSAVWRDKGNKNPYLFNINIIVPNSLKKWYYGLYYISGIMVIFIALLILFYFIYPDCLLLQSIKTNIPKGIYALVAALITTRSWLMREEYCLGKLSNLYTYLTLLLIIEAIMLSAL